MEELLKELKLNNQLKYQLLMSNIIANLDFKNQKDKEILLLLLQDRDRNFIRINNNKQCYENIKTYLNILQPLDIPQDELIRIGGNTDGGYIMFHQDNELNNPLNGKAISLGVSESSPWDLDMANRGFKVIEYDASIKYSPYQHENITFHKKFIGVKNEGEYINIEKVVKDNNLNKKDMNILQCDIENSEWDMLDNIDIELFNDHFKQIIFEFHGCNPEEQEGFEKRKSLLEKINQFYYPFHVHLNNHGKIFYSNGLFFSTTLEVSYIRKKDLDEKNILYNYKTSGTTKLDYPSWPSNPEIPLKFEFKEDNDE